jgi:N utilization substance protein A
VPWHPDPEIFARRALAPARVAKVLSDSARRVSTAIVDEDQLSLAIGRNGQNVRLASQLIGWQIDLYGSREWLERGADAALFGGSEPEYEVADFPLRELDLPLGTLAALETAGYTSFLDIIDLEKEDLLRIPGLTAEQAEEVVKLIESLTVEDSSSDDPDSPSEQELAEARELAADILNLKPDADQPAVEPDQVKTASEPDAADDDSDVEAGKATASE